jgi:hypothetical protein
MRARERALRENHREQLGIAPARRRPPQQFEIRVEQPVHRHRIGREADGQKMRPPVSRQVSRLARPPEEKDPLLVVECAEVAQRLVAGVVPRVRRGRELDDVAGARGDHPQRFVSLGSSSGLMRLVDNQQVPQLRGKPSGDFGLLQKIDRGDGDRLHAPGIYVERNRVGQRGERSRVDDGSADAESTLQLVGPLPSQPRRRDDECAIARPALLKLREHESGLDRLAKAHFVGQQETRRVTTRERQGRLQLEWQDVDRRARRGAQPSEHPPPGEVRTQVVHELPA